MDIRTIESWFFLVLLLGAIIVVALMFAPFLNALIIAIVLAFLLSGIQTRLAHALRSPGWAAALLTLGSLLLVVVPLVFLAWRGIQEAAGLYAYLQWLATPDTLSALAARIWDYAAPVAPWLKVDSAALSQAAESALAYVLARSGDLFASIGRLGIQSFILLVTLFYFLRDGAKLTRKLMDISPLSDAHEHVILSKVSITVGSIVRGKVLIAIIQGVVAGIGFWLFGVPLPVLWGAAVMVTSFVPTIGGALVQIPAIIYLLATGETGPAIGLTLWAVFAVGLIDNALGPRLMAEGADIHPLAIMLSVFGGLALFGPMGIFIGPIIIALLYALGDIWLTLVKRPTTS